MKKKFVLCAALLALAFTGCEKTGTIEGVVLDPFTGKAVEMPTVWMDSTIFGTHAPKYAHKGILKEGKFKFEKVPVGDYLIKARRNKYVLTQQKFSTTEANPNANLTLYSYSDQVDPGLYTASAEGPVKISNEWVIWSASCSESVAAYRENFPQDADAGKVPNQNKKKKKKSNVKMVPLPAPRVVDANLAVFYRNASSVTTPLVAISYPAVVGSVADHADCKGFDASEKKGVFADKDKGTALNVAYKAEGLFEITANLPKGKQIIQFSQDGKSLQTYYFEVK